MALPEPLDALDGEDRAVLDRYLETVQFPAGALVFEEGSPGDGCFIIDDGEIRLEVARPEVDSDGVLGFLEPGTILGELSLLDSQPRSASAYAHTAVTGRRLDLAAIERLVAEHPRIGLAVYRALGRDAAQKLRQTTQKLADFVVTDVDPDVDAMVRRARAAQEAFASWSDAEIDRVLEAVATAVAAEAQGLAEETVRETKIGSVVDKTYKNQVASLGVWRSLAGQGGRGVLQIRDEAQVTEIASPAGIIFAMIPMTNPVATAVFKTLIALRGGNSLILSFHRAALGVGNRTGEIMRAACEQAGAPGDLIQWIRQRASRKKTAMFLGHKGISLILATGGAGMVRAAYSSGTPAIGVGPSNTPCLICADADPAVAAEAVLQSKPFDHGLICGAEHNLVVDRTVRDAFVSALEAGGAAVLDADETRTFQRAVVDPQTGGLRPQVIGQGAAVIAKHTGVTRPYPVRLIVVPTDDPSPDNPFAGEKICPMLSLFTVQDAEEGFAVCRRLLAFHGAGHTAVIHTADEERIQRFGREMPAGRILVNSPAVQGVVGITSGLEPSFTLGCGTFGNNSTTDNVSWRNLINVKRLARYRAPAPADAG